jgi:hypothetical protein
VSFCCREVTRYERNQVESFNRRERKGNRKERKGDSPTRKKEF